MNPFYFWLINYAIGVASVSFQLASLCSSQNTETLETLAVAGAGSLLIFWSAFITTYVPFILVI